MKIKEIIIKQLYDEYDFHWKLNHDSNYNVNILAGDNGSFKTTILNVITSLLSGTLLRTSKYSELKSVDIYLTDDSIIEYRTIKDNLLSIREKAEEDEVFRSLKTRLESDYAEKNDEELTKMNLSGDILMFKKDNIIIPTQQISDYVKFDYISTFDRPIKEDDDKEKSKLDIKLAKLESQYAYYLSDLLKQFRDIYKKDGKVDDLKDKELNTQIQIFTNIVNECFRPSGKELDNDSTKLFFKVKSSGRKLSIDKLSSGEKQLLIILLASLLERNSETIFIMDEPEISMHIEWQRTLIDNILKLNPNCQIIATTHSPGLILNGWELNVQQMRDITFNSSN